MKRLLPNFALSLAATCGGLSTLFILAASPAVAQNTGSLPAASTTATAAPGYTFPQGILFPYWILDKALENKIDKSGNVDYTALKSEKALDLFLKAVATADLSKFPTFQNQPDPKDKTGKITTDRSAELAFWINAYNAHVLKTLAEAYPVSSPDEIKGFHIAKTHVVAGKTWSLQEMRDKIVEFDPRALFTLSDGTRGGPMLARQAYRYVDISDPNESRNMLNIAVKTFVNDPRNVEVVRIQNKVTLNEVFALANDLFARVASNPDPRKKMSGIRLLLSLYTSQRGERSYLTTNDYQIAFKPRDRSLNRKES